MSANLSSLVADAQASAPSASTSSPGKSPSEGGLPKSSKSAATAPPRRQRQPKSKGQSGAASTAPVSETPSDKHPVSRVPVDASHGTSVAEGAASTVERAKRAQDAHTASSQGGKVQKPKNAKNAKNEATPVTGRHFARKPADKLSGATSQPQELPEEERGRDTHVKNYVFAAKMLEAFCGSLPRGRLDRLVRMKLSISEDTISGLNGEITRCHLPDFIKKISSLVMGHEDATEQQLRELLISCVKIDSRDGHFAREFRAALTNAFNYDQRLKTCESLAAECELKSVGEFIVESFAYAIVHTSFTFGLAARNMLLMPRLTAFVKESVSFSIRKEYQRRFSEHGHERCDRVRLDSDDELNVLIGAEEDNNVSLDTLTIVRDKVFNFAMNSITRYLQPKVGKERTLFSSVLYAYENPHRRANSDSSSASASGASSVEDQVEDISDDVPPGPFTGTRFFCGAKAAVCEYVASAIGLAADRQACDLAPMFVSNLVSTGPIQDDAGTTPTHFGVTLSDNITSAADLFARYRQTMKRREEKKREEEPDLSEAVRKSEQMLAQTDMECQRLREETQKQLAHVYEICAQVASSPDASAQYGQRVLAAAKQLAREDVEYDEMNDF